MGLQEGDQRVGPETPGRSIGAQGRQDILGQGVARQGRAGEVRAGAGKALRSGVQGRHRQP
ncbi:MAG: hypothetical protein WCC38_06550, partial [Pseudonocardiaceae bacterium]